MTAGRAVSGVAPPLSQLPQNATGHCGAGSCAYRWDREYARRLSRLLDLVRVPYVAHGNVVLNAEIEPGEPVFAGVDDHEVLVRPHDRGELVADLLHGQSRAQHPHVAGSARHLAGFAQLPLERF